MPELSGRELDAAVARAIGADRIWQGDTGYAPYSSDATTALEAYAVMRERGWMLWKCQHYDQITGWEVWLSRPSEETQGRGSTFSKALCRAIVAAHERERR